MTTMSEISDKEILDLFRSGKEDQAFSLLVKKYQKRLYYHIRRMTSNHDDADDVLQNTFIKSWTGLKNFREDASLYTWIYRIATNETFTFLSKSKNTSFVSIDQSGYRPSTNAEGDGNVLEGDAIYAKLQQAINTLPEKQKMVFNMKYYEEMPYEQMSQVLDTSVGALKASYHHAVKKIEEFLTGH